MSDDYEPALEVPEASIGASDAIGDAEGAALEVREVVRDRGVKETTRKLFADAAKKLKPQLDASEGDELEVAIGNDDQPAAAAGASAPPVSKQPPPAAAAPASDPVAQAVDTRATAELEIARKAFDDERKAFDAQRAEWETKLAPIRDKYAENPAAAIMALVKEWTGAATDDEVKDELADLITELSSVGLGTSVPEQHKTRMESRRALRQVKAYKAEQAKKDAESAKRAEQQRQEQTERETVRSLNHELSKPDALKQFPYLAAEDDPGAIVWAVVKTKHQQSGAVPTWEECAKLADEHFKKKSDAWLAKRPHLLAPAAPQALVVESAPQGDPQSRRSSTLTNKTTAPVPPAASSDADGLDRDAHRSRSLGALRQRMKESAT